MLKMKSCCEKCQAATEEQGVAFICSFECTFCQTCTEQMNAICPNCSGELVIRPTRMKKPLEVTVDE